MTVESPRALSLSWCLSARCAGCRRVLVGSPGEPLGALKSNVTRDEGPLALLQVAKNAPAPGQRVVIVNCGLVEKKQPASKKRSSPSAPDSSSDSSSSSDDDDRAAKKAKKEAKKAKKELKKQAKEKKKTDKKEKKEKKEKKAKKAKKSKKE